MKSRLILPAAALLACSAAANANIVFMLGNNPQPGEQNILLNTGETGLLSVLGTTNQTGTSVRFSSTQLLAEPSSGQSRVARDIAGATLTNLSISLKGGGTYGDLIINPFLSGSSCTACTPGNATITVTPTGEPAVSFTYSLGNGNNFLTIVATNGEKISSTSINAPGGFGELRQPRISGVAAAAVPEPTTELPIAAAGMFLLAVIKKIRLR